MQTISKLTAFSALPQEWGEPLLPAIQARLRQQPHKLVVLDDDPTGTQTVHDVPVLTSWAIDVLRAEFKRPGGVFYILTNSRSLSPMEARALNVEIGHNLAEAAGDMPFRVVSRSDSTLRGHFPLELHALTDALQTKFDGWLVVPFFEEGGRYTLDNVHYVAEGDQLIPAHETPFARDASFGYTTANLTEWVAEKTGGAVPAEAVRSIRLDMLRVGGPDAVFEYLLSLRDAEICVVNAASYRDMEILVVALLRAEAQGRRFLYRTAASFVRARAGLDARPLLTAADLHIDDKRGGLIVVGSYVPKTTAQVRYLLEHTAAVPVELDVTRLLSEEGDAHIQSVAQQVDEHLARAADTVLYTSRELVTGIDADSSLLVGQRISDGLIAVLNQLNQRPGFIVAKGGITSSDVATRALGVRRALVRGQIAPGVPVWELDTSSRYPELPYVVFPGNVGDETTLTSVLSALTASAEYSTNA